MKNGTIIFCPVAHMKVSDEQRKIFPNLPLSVMEDRLIFETGNYF